ncbi:Separin [Balamuthia mandrillaris]
MQDRNLRLRRMANEEKANSEEVDVDVLSSMFSSLSTCEGGTEETEEEIRAMLCFLREDVHVLPDDWTVCSLSLFSSEQDDFSNGHQRKSSHLLLSRHQANRSPIVARIPLSTTNVEGEPMSTLQQHLKEFEDIMAESQKSTDASSLQLTTDSEKRGWWRRRKKLDQRMQHLLYSIEEEWLGHWKCLLLGSLRLQEDDGKCNKKAATLAERLASLFSEAAEEAISVALDEELFRVCFASIPELAEEQGVECLIHVLGWKPNRVNEASRAKLTKFWQEMNQEYIEVMPLVEEEELSDRNPVFLILDKDLQHLPWECIPIMVNRAVARVPSIRFLAQHSNNKDRLFIDGIRSDNTRYLLNPSQDLPKTQKTFKPYFERQKGWRGITGEVPTEDQFREMLTESDLFIYCGHSTGERYLNAVHLQNLQRCAVTLLMGCSSGKLAPSGAFEPMGVVLNYLLCGW